ncbi:MULTISPECIES: hypothetical protein [Serratia]|uniref:Uncharacterized protein n=1 Tax=Serratia ureilytica TaxID=300181 RepID=A0A9X9G0Q6_9GAMM|nr:MULTISPECIES: hypothetical protein [Serratia]MBS3894861.1 hypothetical protein [Serratia marcescens]TXE24635.1 hypothetical protein FOT63_23625 [Serratia ureilytica]
MPGLRELRRLLGVLGLLGALLLSAPGYALCLCGNQVVTLTTPYHFGAGPVRVGGNEPLGTVIASTIIPEGSVITRCDGDVSEGLWNARGLHARYRMAPTNVAGIGVRVVSEKTSPATDDRPGLPWRWNARKPLRSITQGGLRIELVKTGPIQPGVMTAVGGDMQYRLYTGRAPHLRLSVVERLRYVGQLVIEVSGAVQGHQRLS